MPHLNKSKNLLTKLIIEETDPFSIHVEPLTVKGYEKVLKITEKSSGLKAIIALHNTTLGPALGGIRIQPYPTFDHALEDVLRLAEGMTYKSAIAEVGFGGGKSVIIADPKTEKTPELLLAFGAAVNQLKGAYVCAEDVGSTLQDCKIIRQITPYVVGLPHVNSSGDPAPFTAWGVFRGIQASAKSALKKDSLEGVVIAVQGLGNVGSHLVEFLFWAGAHIIVSDIDREKVERIVTKYKIKSADPSSIHQIECDIFVPCALGGGINSQTIPEFRCKVIAGSANNQLAFDSDAVQLKEKGIFYAPDFVINAGGLLNVAGELEELGYDPAMARGKISRIYGCVEAIYAISEKNHESTQSVAIALAEHRIKYGIGKRWVPPTFPSTLEF